MNTAKDGLTSVASVQTLNRIIDKNLSKEGLQEKIGKTKAHA
jgi:hypothetical protein